MEDMIKFEEKWWKWSTVGNNQLTGIKARKKWTNGKKNPNTHLLLTLNKINIKWTNIILVFDLLDALWQRS